MAIYREYALAGPPEQARQRIERELGPKVLGFRTGDSPLTGRVSERGAVLWLAGTVLGPGPVPRMEVRFEPTADGTLVRVCIRWSRWMTGIAAFVFLASAAASVSLLARGRWEGLVVPAVVAGFVGLLKRLGRGSDSELLRLADALFS